MSLFKRGRIWWSYVFEDGVRHALSTNTSNRRLAEQIDHKHKEELRLKALQFPELKPDMTFAELAGWFLNQGTAKHWHRDRLKVLLPFFAEMPIGRINRAAVRQYRQQRHSKKTLTETTVNRDIQCLRHLLYQAVDEGYLTINPIARIRLERERRKKKPVLSHEEEVRLLESAAPHLHNIILMALDTGLRRGEILKQLWEDVDFSRRLLYVSHSKTPEGEAREVPLTARLFNLLHESRQAAGLIFTYKGRALSRIKTAWKAAIRRAGIRYIRFHYLRHTFNTRLLELGVSREVRMALLGHTFGDTHECYEHVELPLKREAIRKLDAWLTAEHNKKGEIDVEITGPDDRADSGAHGA